MRLSEIAEFVVDKYPNCCMASNNVISKGCREDWYEEYLIDELSIVEVPLLGDESDKNFFLSTTYRQFTLIENKDCLFFNYKRYKAK